MNLSFLNVFRKRFAVLCHDLAWVPSSIFLAYWFRFNVSTIPDEFLQGMFWMLSVATPIYAYLFWFFGLYRGVWRFASVPDLIRVIKAVAVGCLVTLAAIFVLQRGAGVPRLVFMVYPMLLVLGLAVPRILYRWIKDHHIFGAREELQRTLVVGAGRVGEHLLRSLIRSGQYLPVAIVDPNPAMHGMEIHGVRVEGGLDSLAAHIRRLEIQMVIVAIAQPAKDDLESVLRISAEAKVPTRIVAHQPKDGDWWLGESPLRDITVEDLLSREPVALDMGRISGYLRGRRVLITGAGGSIGSELCRQVAAQEPGFLIIFDHSEYNLFQIDQVLRSTYPNVQIQTVLGDVKDQHRVDWLFSKFEPKVVFHAAAYKHVPMLEGNPIQGVHNNVFGTKIVADAAHRSECEDFVLISTDKAVNPANLMGVTKRIAEIYVQNLNGHSATHFLTTRFGNVLRSAGSVVPIFEAQIARGGPVTVTHPEITRYFMTIPEAVALILQAGAMGDGGEIFVLDMGQPIKIKDLAEQMIRLAGREPDRDIAIEYTGLRAGEKLFEELFHESEGLIGTSHPKLLLAEHRQLNWGWLQGELSALQDATRLGNVELVMQRVKSIVPEYTGPAEEPPVPEGPPKPVALTIAKRP